jgi:hypothetical protein
MVVLSPVSGSTREILPATVSVTYSAPSGPTVLPKAPSRPSVSSSGSAACHDGEALAAFGVTSTVIAAATTSESVHPSSAHHGSSSAALMHAPVHPALRAPART